MALNDALLQEALALIERTAKLPAQDRERLLYNFRARGEDYEAALVAAERFANQLQHYRPRRFSAAEQRAIKGEARTARLRERRTMLSAMACVLGGCALWWAFEGDITQPSLPPAQPLVSTEAEVFRTGRRHQQIALADGSTLWLDWRSEAEVEITDQVRWVVLRRGRAAFAVAEDLARPFSVTASGIVTRVTGTEFVVDARDAESPMVSVLKGSVAVSGQDQTIELTRNARIQAVKRRLQRLPDASEYGLDWREGKLVLRSAPLGKAFETLAPYTNLRVDVAGLAEASARVSGTYFLDRADDAVFALIETHRLRTERTGRTLRLYPPLPTRH
ncbi:MAG: FecR domain-containing protein [Pseudomonadota bacterium]